MDKLEALDVLPIVKTLLKIIDDTENVTLEIIVNETMQRVENYINQPPPIALKYAVARLAVAAYNTNYKENSGKVAAITEDKRKVEFARESDSVDLNLNKFSVEVEKELQKYRVIVF